MERDTRVPPRDFGFRIVIVEIDVGEDAAIGIPSSNLRLVVAKGELFACRTSALNYQLCMSLAAGIRDRGYRLLRRHRHASQSRTRTSRAFSRIAEAVTMPMAVPFTIR